MTCELCKHNKVEIFIKNEQGTLILCKECHEELQLSLGYYINGNEVIKEEWDERIK